MGFKVVVVIVGLLLVGCGGPNRNFSYQIKDGAKSSLLKAHSAKINSIICQDSIIARTVKNLIAQEFLTTKIILTDTGVVDVLIDLTVTLTSDQAGGGSAMAYHGSAGASFSNSSGSYISGINAQLMQANSLLASLTVSQSRTEKGIPDAPEEISLQIAKKIVCVLTDSTGYCM